jgi:hypothetical protein
MYENLTGKKNQTNKYTIKGWSTSEDVEHLPNQHHSISSNTCSDKKKPEIAHCNRKRKHRMYRANKNMTWKDLCPRSEGVSLSVLWRIT